MKYAEPETPDSHEVVEAAIKAREYELLIKYTVWIGLYELDLPWSQEILIQLSHCEDPTVRGNAILSFGHLARRFGTLDAARVQPLIEGALADPDWHVSGQAYAAASDVEHFLGWQVRGRPRDGQ